MTRRSPGWIWIRSICRIPSANDIRELQADNLRLHSRILEMEKHMKCMQEQNVKILNEEEIEEHEAV